MYVCMHVCKMCLVGVSGQEETGSASKGFECEVMYMDAGGRTTSWITAKFVWEAEGVVWTSDCPTHCLGCATSYSISSIANTGGMCP